MSEVPDRASERSESAVEPDAAVDLELPGRSFGAVGRLVVAGIASRLGMRVDRIDELQLAVDAALRQPVSRDVLALRMTPSHDDLELELGPLRVAEDEREGLERVLSALVDEVATRESGDGVWVDMRVVVDPLAPASR